MTTNDDFGRDDYTRTDGTQVNDTYSDEVRDRDAERAERDRRLGKVDRPTEDPVAAPQIRKRTTDRFPGSLGLFLLRLVTGAIMGVHGYQKLMDIDGTQQFFDSLGLPEPFYFAWGMGIAEVLAAVALILGFLVRFAGAGVAAIAIGALALVKWGAVNPFQDGQAGFIGELELLLAAVGVLFLLVGGGRWGIDGALRKRRQLAKAGY